MNAQCCFALVQSNLDSMTWSTSLNGDGDGSAALKEVPKMQTRRNTVRWIQFEEVLINDYLVYSVTDPGNLKIKMCVLMSDVSPCELGQIKLIKRQL